jgi:tetrahydrodipicolinate N-succinyltransferase
MSDERPEWHRHPNGGGWVQDTAHVDDTAYVGPDAQVSGSARVYGSARVCGSAWVSGSARVFGNAQVYGNAQVFGDAEVFGAARVSGNAQVFGDAEVFGAAQVFGAARVSAPRHVLTVGPIGSEDQTLTLFRTETGYGVSVGCWRPDGATLDDLTAEVQRRAPDHADEYEAAMALCRVRIAEWEKR